MTPEDFALTILRGLNLPADPDTMSWIAGLVRDVIEDPCYRAFVEDRLIKP